MKASIAPHPLVRLACAVALVAASAGVGSRGMSRRHSRPVWRRSPMRITRRDMFAVAVADEATMAQLDKYRQIGKGHVVMFANRPYWRWQTQGDFFLGFNAILNWNDLDAGRAPARPWDRRRSNNVERFRRLQHQAQSAGRDPILNTAACRGATQGLHAARTG